MADDFSACYCFVLFSSFVLLIENLTFVASIISMQGIAIIILSAFLKQGYVFIQEHDYLTYQIWKLRYSYLSSYNPYIELL